MLGNTYRDKDKETGFFEDLLSHGVRGVIVISSLVDEQHFEQAVQRGLVVVSYDRRATPGASAAIDHVTVDNCEAARTWRHSHLISHGHQRLAFATASGQTTSRSDKIQRLSVPPPAAAGLADTARVIDRQPAVRVRRLRNGRRGAHAGGAHRRRATAADRRRGRE